MLIITPDHKKILLLHIELKTNISPEVLNPDASVEKQI